MTRSMLWVLRGIAIAAFIIFTSIILVFLVPTVWRFDGPWGAATALVEFAIETRNVISLLVDLFSTVAAGIGAALGSLFNPGAFDYLLNEYLVVIRAFFQALGFSNPRPLDQIFPAFMTSLYFLGFQLLLIVGILAGILSFLRVSGRLASICFISMIGIAILGAAGIVTTLPGSASGFFMVPWSTTLPYPQIFFLSLIFIVAMTSYIYLEASYQVVYFYALLEPPTVREEQLRRQVQQIQTDAEAQEPVQRREVPVPKALQRMLGSDAFRLMRQVIEQKLLRREYLVELKDAHEIRRLNSYVERLFREDHEAERALTARASLPSLKKMTMYSIGSTIIRFVFIIIVAYFCLYPEVFLILINAPQVIISSVEFLFLPEKTLFLLLPLLLLFPLAATIIGYLRQRQIRTVEESTGELSQ